MILAQRGPSLILQASRPVTAGVCVRHVFYKPTMKAALQRSTLKPPIYAPQKLFLWKFLSNIKPKTRPGLLPFE